MSGTARETERRRITSPEELHDCIRVTNPNLWILLAMMIAMLAGLIVLASTITIENTTEVQAEVLNAPDGEASLISCTLTDGRKNNIRIGMEARVAGETGTVRELIANDEVMFVTIGLDREGARLKDGIYDAEIVLERTTPISFLFSAD